MLMSDATSQTPFPAPFPSMIGPIAMGDGLQLAAVPKEYMY